MTEIYLTPGSVSYLAALLLVGTIGVYLLYFWFKQRVFGGELFFLTAFFVVFMLNMGLFWLDAVLLPQARLYAVYVENTLLALALVLMLQFAYRVPQLMPSATWERRAALTASLMYALYEAWTMVERFASLGSGDVSYRSSESDYFLMMILLWLPVAFFRQGIAADTRPISAWRKVFSFKGEIGARTAHGFGVVYLFLLLLGVTNILRGDSRVSAMAYNIVLSVGFLVATWLFATIYINFRLEMTSFLVKLSGTMLLVLLTFWGAVGWALAPVRAETFLPALADYQTLRFIPNAEGGYTISEVDFAFEPDFGERLPVTSRGEGRNAAVAFSFPLFGKEYNEVYVTSVGMLRMGEPLYHPNLQNGYGHTAAIFPLLVDLEPEWGGGVYARVDSDQMVATWHDLRALYDEEQVYTFQAVLYHDGSFTFTYNGLPAPIVYAPDAAPSSSAWVRGITSGSGLPEIRTSALLPGDSINAAGLLQDFYLGSRIHLNALMQPLSIMLLISTIVLLLLAPLLLRRALVQPLDYLLHGVRQIEMGDLNVQIPFVGQDEFGLLTNAFNRMVAQQKSLVSNLEARVAERTQSLREANAQLNAEMQATQAAQSQILSQQRQLATLDERMRLSRELHDGLAQSIGFIVVQSQAVQDFVSKQAFDSALEGVSSIGRVAQLAHADLRQFILGLRTEISAPKNFLEALQQYTDQIEQEFELRVNLSLPEEQMLTQLPPAIEQQVLYILQESLTNIQKHAQAIEIQIIVECDSKVFRMSILDNGIGFEKNNPNVDAGTHFGLQMMQERAQLIGGEVEVRSQVGRGTKVLLRVPLAVGAPHATHLPNDNLHPARLPRVLLVDDSPLFLEGLRNLLMARGIPVVGVAINGIEAQQQAALLRPNVIVMDIAMPQCNGLDATRAITLAFPEIKVIMLTASEDPQNLLAALQLGAAGFLLKGSDANEFCEALIKLNEGETILPPYMLSAFVQSHIQQVTTPEATTCPQLTARQQEIMDLVIQGLTYREIGLRVHLSEKTIKYHMAQILERLQVSNRIEAVARLHQQH